MASDNSIRLEEYLWTNDNQFRFKSGHSTGICIYALTEFIEYNIYTSVYKRMHFVYRIILFPHVWIWH